ncbi:MAG: hypothetical protein JKY66_11230 [Spongiibacteraceae bacterium]|nr:hypothetical protein [Spongiibacteraceae bacterium]
MLRQNEAEVEIMYAENHKQAAYELLEGLPDDISWSEIAYRMEVRASIERGMADVKAGRVYSHEEVKKHFGIKD